MHREFVKIVATFFYTGYFPFASGTVGSFAAICLAVLVLPYPLIFLLLTIFWIIIGLMVSGPMEKMAGTKDPSCVVIDEVAGMFVSLLFLPPSLWIYILGFFLFRFFDITKLFPANRIEKIGGASGIMFDDVVAGIYANICLRVLIYFFPGIL